jgi:tetratricopeptide (TPR) repeat protein
VDRKSIITVEPMDVEQAVQLLRKKLDCEHTNEEALELTKALDFMPLAINQAAAYISQEWPRCSVQQYQEKLLKSDKSKFSLLNLDEGDLRRDREAANSILSTWQISFEHIRAVRSSASDLLSLMSFFERQAIPESVLRLTPAPLEERSPGLHQILGKRKRERATPIQINGDESETAAEDFNLDIKMLRSYSFISAATADTFTMHSLVQFATRKWLQARSEEGIWIARFVYCLYEVWPRKGEYEDWSTCAALYPHIKAAHSLKPTERSASETWACLLYTSAGYAWNRGLPVDARTMSALSSNELVRLEGRESKLALRSMMDLARYTLETQSPATVGHLQAQLVETSKKIYGDDTVVTAKCKCLLAESYSYQGRWKDVETLYVKAVQTMRRALGDEHPTTLISMSNLAEAYWSQELCEEAPVLGEYIFEVRKRVLGPMHLDTLVNKANLALTYSDLGLHKKAAMLGSQTLETQKRLFGPGHPETLVTMANLALTFSRQGFWDKAIPLSTQALDMLKKMYGHEHARTLAHMRNLAYMYQQQMSHKKSIELWSEAFEASKRALGPEHRDTLSTMADLAQSLQDDGQRQSASDLMELCAVRSLDGLGPTHPETVERRQLAEDWRKELMGLGEDDQHDSDGGAYCQSDEDC